MIELELVRALLGFTRRGAPSPTTGIVTLTLGANSMRALGVRSSYEGRTVDASAMRGDEGRGQLRKASGSR